MEQKCIMQKHDRNIELNKVKQINVLIIYYYCITIIIRPTISYSATSENTVFCDMMLTVNCKLSQTHHCIFK